MVSWDQGNYASGLKLLSKVYIARCFRNKISTVKACVLSICFSSPVELEVQASQSLSRAKRNLCDGLGGLRL